MAHQYKTLPQRDPKETMESLRTFYALSHEEQAEHVSAARLRLIQEQALRDIAHVAMTSERGISEKQMKYLDSLLQQVEAGAPAEADFQAPMRVQHTPLLPVPKLHEMLKRGHGVVWFQAEGRYVRCKYTGREYTQYPDSWHVLSTSSSAELHAGKPAAHDGTYMGRITPEGEFKPVSSNAADFACMIMQAIECAPLAAAVAYAQAIGCCAFCNRELTDEPSVAAGYGPICADKYELPWGDGKVAVYKREIDDGASELEY